MPFLLGGLTPELYTTSQVKHISHIREADGLQDQDVVEFLGHVLVFDSKVFVTEAVSKRSVCNFFRNI